MKKLLASVLCGAMALASIPVANAATATGSFNVKVNLTSSCQLTTAPTDITLAYSSFNATTVTGSTPFTVQCTNTLPYTLSLDSSSADQLGLSVPLLIRDGGDTTTIVASQTAGTTAANYIVKASIASGQQGTCATATCSGSVSRTLTVTY